jgi:ketosteroid isomerase-like protein
MKITLSLFISFMAIYATASYAQSKDELAIRDILSGQVTTWNNGDLQSFMRGYWQNDSLKFIGKSGITYGWKQTLENYKKNYPDTLAMGKLDFDLIEVKQLSALYFFVVGKWQLTRSIGNLKGHFTLLFKKINNKWVIVADHSS